MALPVSVLDELSENEMVLVTGGFGNGEAANNGDGKCLGTNNGTGTCEGINNGNGVCNGHVNNGDGRCNITKPDPGLIPAV